MRPLLPLFLTVVAGLALSSAALAEDTFVIKSVSVETKVGALQAAPAEGTAAADKTVAVLQVAEPATADLAPAADPDQKKAEILRGSLFMLILPNLCCRY